MYTELLAYQGTRPSNSLVETYYVLTASEVFVGKSQTKAHTPVVQKVDSVIRLINVRPLDSAIAFPSTYPLDSKLSSG